jgi:hypothetical protein
MPEDPSVVPTSQSRALAILLLILVVTGVALYFRSGTRLPAFGSVEPTTAVDTSR